MGNNAPSGYLKCDGTIYNINDYKNLAEQIKTEFGSYNYFGGDGTTTFAVSDLQGEFLRGTGTNTTTGYSGSNVGVHQRPTLHANIMSYYSGSGTSMEIGTTNQANSKGASNADSYSSGQYSYYSPNMSIRTNDPRISLYTSRPTNTSVLYCIKY